MREIMTKFEEKTDYGNNTCNIRMLQALMKQHNFHSGEVDGKIANQMVAALTKFNEDGMEAEKNGKRYVLSPAGSVIASLSLGLSSYYNNMKGLKRTGEVIFCSDDDWKAGKVTFPNVGMPAKEQEKMQRRIDALWNDYRLPLSISADINNEVKWFITISFPDIKWLNIEGNFIDTKPKAITDVILKEFSRTQFIFTSEDGNSVTMTGPLMELMALEYETGKCADIKKAIIAEKEKQITSARVIYRYQKSLKGILKESEHYGAIIDNIQKRNKERLSGVTFGLLSDATVASAEYYDGAKSGKTKLKPYVHLVKRLNLLDVNATPIADLYYTFGLAQTIIQWIRVHSETLVPFGVINGLIAKEEKEYQAASQELIKYHQDLEDNGCKPFYSHFYNEYGKLLNKAFTSGQ